MLSAETASGAYPIEAVEMMDRIAAAVEADPLYQSIIESQRTPPEATTPDAIMAAVHEVTHTIHARAIVCWTESGSTALRAARERSEAPIVVLTPSLADRAPHGARAGACTACTPRTRTTGRRRRPRLASSRYRKASPGPASASSSPPACRLGTPGATNMLRVAFVGGK